mmetsp:Transcript_38879/g.126110  ORF Transcript_38879/g.126110 Transcript_38879/m.126110 type:complete len:300 (+) Transcript_38879:627-1526(+)
MHAMRHARPSARARGRRSCGGGRPQRLVAVRLVEQLLAALVRGQHALDAVGEEGWLHQRVAHEREQLELLGGGEGRRALGEPAIERLEDDILAGHERVATQQSLEHVEREAVKVGLLRERLEKVLRHLFARRADCVKLRPANRDCHRPGGDARFERECGRERLGAQRQERGDLEAAGGHHHAGKRLGLRLEPQGVQEAEDGAHIVGGDLADSHHVLGALAHRAGEERLEVVGAGGEHEPMGFKALAAVDLDGDVAEAALLPQRGKRGVPCREVASGGAARGGLGARALLGHGGWTRDTG